MTLLNKLQNTFSYKMRINSSLNQLSFFPPETGTSILYTVLEATQRTPLPSSWWRSSIEFGSWICLIRALRERSQIWTKHPKEVTIIDPSTTNTCPGVSSKDFSGSLATNLIRKSLENLSQTNNCPSRENAIKKVDVIPSSAFVILFSRRSLRDRRSSPDSTSQQEINPDSYLL